MLANSVDFYVYCFRLYIALLFLSLRPQAQTVWKPQSITVHYHFFVKKGLQYQERDNMSHKVKNLKGTLSNFVAPPSPKNFLLVFDVLELKSKLFRWA